MVLLTSTLRNKFELVTEMVRDKVDLLIVSEKKFDSTFPDTQSNMKSYSKPYRLDRNSKAGGIILYVRKDVPSKLINSSCIDLGKKNFLVKLFRRKQKRRIICNYDP